MGAKDSKHKGQTSQQTRTTRPSAFQPDQLELLNAVWRAMEPDAHNVVSESGFMSYLKVPENLKGFSGKLYKAWVVLGDRTEARAPGTAETRKSPNNLTHAAFLEGVEKCYRTAGTSEQCEFLGRMYADPSTGRLGQEQLMTLCIDLSNLAAYCSDYEDSHFLPSAATPQQPSAAVSEVSSDGNSDNNSASSPAAAAAVESESESESQSESQSPHKKHDEGEEEGDEGSSTSGTRSKYAKLNIQVPTVKGGVSVNPMNEPRSVKSDGGEPPVEEQMEAERQARVTRDARLTRALLRGLLAAAWDFGDKKSNLESWDQAQSQGGQRHHDDEHEEAQSVAWSLSPVQLGDWALECAPSLSRPLENLMHLRFFMPEELSEEQKKLHRPIALLPMGIGMDKSSLFGQGILWILDLLFDDRRGMWRLLYNSYAHGHSLNRFVHHVVGYEGPTVMLIRTTDGSLLGAYLHTPWQTVPKFIGDSSTFLFSLTPKLVVKRPSGVEKNYAYLYDKKGSFSGYPVGVGFGGSSNNSAFRLHLDDDLTTGHVRQLDSTYQSGPLLPHPTFEAELIEVWGCGGTAAELAHTRAQNLKGKMAERARKVNRAQAASGWSSGPDKFIMDLLGKTGASDEFIDEVNAAKKKVAASKASAAASAASAPAPSK